MINRVAILGSTGSIGKSLLNIIEDKESGEPRLSHRIDKSTGVYNGRQILKPKSKTKV